MLKYSNSRHMFFTMEDQDEQFSANVDPFMDSYTRDTTIDELKDVRHSPADHDVPCVAYTDSTICDNRS